MVAVSSQSTLLVSLIEEKHIQNCIIKCTSFKHYAWERSSSRIWNVDNSNMFQLSANKIESADETSLWRRNGDGKWEIFFDRLTTLPFISHSISGSNAIQLHIHSNSLNIANYIASCWFFARLNVKINNFTHFFNSNKFFTSKLLAKKKWSQLFSIVIIVY